MSISRCATQVALAFVFFSPTFAQQPAPTGQDRSKQAIKAKVRVVLLDVVVTDSKSHPVNDALRQQDFSIFEDGKLQQIVSFESHQGASESAIQDLSEHVGLGPNVFMNAPGPRDSLPLNILVYDLLNTPVEDQPFAHQEIVKFLKHKPAGGRYAIFVLTDRLRLLQGFTDDEGQLLSALNRPEAQSSPSADYQTQQQVHETSSQILATLNGASGPAAAAVNASTQTMVTRLAHMEDSARNYLLTKRVERTLGAFSGIAQFVTGLPGRKNLIWLSGSFPATILATSDPIDPFGSAVNYNPELRQAADLLTVSEIAVYPVDIRGLQTNPVFSVAGTNLYASSGAFLQAYSAFGVQLAAEHDLMDKIAEDSGGHAFYESNGLERAIATSIEDGSNYYTLSYSPTNLNFDGRLRKIRVSLDKKSYHLAYRHSYLADDDTHFAEKKNAASSARQDAALRHGAPPTHDLAFILHVVPQGKPVASTPEQVKQFARSDPLISEKQWASSQVERYFIDYTIPGRQLSFTISANTNRHLGLEFTCVAYDSEGNMITGQRSPIREILSPEQAAGIRSGYYRGRQVFDIPSSATSLRVAVRNVVDNRLGALEITLPLLPDTQIQVPLISAPDTPLASSEPRAPATPTPKP